MSRCLTAADNPFIRWCQQKKLFKNQFPKDQQHLLNAQITHLLLDGCRGGCLIVPADLLEEFKEKYAQCIDQGYKLWMNEKRKVVSRGLGDIDAKGTRFLTYEEEANIFKVYQNSFKPFYPHWKSIEQHGDLFRVIVLATETVQVDQLTNGKPIYKHAYHPIMSNLYLTDTQAQEIFETTLAHFENKWPLPQETFGFLSNKWENDVFDRCVLVTNGLRLPGSRKCVKCPQCKNNDEKVVNCEHCDYIGRVDQGRVYSIKYVFDSNGKRLKDLESRYKQNFSALIAASTVQTNLQEPTPGYKRYEGAPLPAQYKVSYNADSGAIALTKDTTSTFVHDPKSNKEKIVLQSNSPLISTIEKCIRSFDPIYQNIQVNKVSTNEKHTYYNVQVKGIGSSRCKNNNSEDHSSNHIYFLIRKKMNSRTQYQETTITVLCYSPRCKDWKGITKPLSGEMSDELFPSYWSKAGIVLKPSTSLLSSFGLHSSSSSSSSSLHTSQSSHTSHMDENEIDQDDMFPHTHLTTTSSSVTASNSIQQQQQQQQKEKKVHEMEFMRKQEFHKALSKVVRMVGADVMEALSGGKNIMKDHVEEQKKNKKRKYQTIIKETNPVSRMNTLDTLESVIHATRRINQSNTNNLSSSSSREVQLSDDEHKSEPVHEREHEHQHHRHTRDEHKTESDFFHVLNQQILTTVNQSTETPISDSHVQTKKQKKEKQSRKKQSETDATNEIFPWLES